MKISHGFMLLLSLILPFTLTGCGYQLGLAGQDTSINNIYIYTVVNKTRKPGLEMPVTNAVINAFHNAGSYLKVVEDKKDADAFLVVKLTRIDRAPARFDESDFLEESLVTLYAEVALYDFDLDPRLSDIQSDENTEEIEPLYHASLAESATYFLQPNQPEGERSIHPQLFDKLSRKIVNSIAERWEYKSTKDE